MKNIIPLFILCLSFFQQYAQVPKVEVETIQSCQDTIIASVFLNDLEDVGSFTLQLLIEESDFFLIEYEMCTNLFSVINYPEDNITTQLTMVWSVPVSNPPVPFNIETDTLIKLTFLRQSGESAELRWNTDFSEVIDFYGVPIVTEFKDGMVSFSPSDPLAIEILEILPASCIGQNNGFVAINGSGGMPPHEYHWSNGEQGAEQNNLAPGEYEVVLVDVNGCQSSFDIIIELEEDIEPPIVLTKDTIITIEESGMVLITPDQIDNGSTDNCHIQSLSLDVFEFDCTDLGEHTITLTAVDPSGNTQYATAQVTIKTNIEIVTDTISETNGAMNGAVDITISGGDGNYSFQWIVNDTIYSTSEDLTNLPAGAYTLIVSDGNGCEASDTIEINNITTVGALDQKIISQFSIFPNPSSGEMFVSIELPKQAPIQLEIINDLGQIVRKLSEPQIINKNYELDLTNYSSGVYLIKCTINNYQFARKVLLMSGD